MINKLALTILVILLFTACDKHPAKEIGYGELNDGTYTNQYFNMVVDVPTGWVVQSEAQNKELIDSGAEMIAGDDENMKNALKASHKQTLTLFSFFKYEQGSPVEFNPSIMGIAERVSGMPGIKRGSDYLFHVKNLLESGQMNYEFPSPIFEKEISGVSFDVMPLQLTMGAVTIHQNYYAAKFEDYVLSLISTYSSGDEEEISHHIHTIKFLTDQT